MTEREWRQRFSALVGAVRTDISEPLVMRPVIFGFWLLFAQAPLAVHTIFEGLEEGLLRERALVLGEQIGRGPLSATPDPTASLDELVEFAACMLRGLELAYVGLGELNWEPRRPEDLAVSWGEDRGWLLPFKPVFRGESTGWPYYFAKRGLQLMRCLPARLSSGHEVELRLARPLKSGDLTCGAVLFNQVTLLDGAGAEINEHSAGPFVVHDIREDLGPGADQALAECAAEICDIVVFPELTVTPDTLGRMVRTLQRKPWGIQQRANAIVVAGSWHVPREDGRAENAAPILDINGRRIGTHTKTIAYSTSGAVEDIVPSERILLVATRTVTVAFAICLDFCQEGRLPNPYDELDADLIVVTSFANEATAKSHEQHADRAWNNRKTGTIVVQQLDQEPFGIVGARPRDPSTPFQRRAVSRVTIVKLHPPP